MSGLALDVSKKAVELLADRVNNAFKKEAEQWQMLQSDLLFITGEFEMMQSFLGAADRKRVRNNVAKTWVTQVQDLSHDTEDCIEFALNLDQKRSWWRSWIRILPSCMISLPVDEAVAEMKLLKARVEDVNQRNMRYNLVSDSGSKDVTQDKQALGASTRALDILVNGRNADANDSAIKNLKNLIITRDDDDNDNDGSLRVISVCGIGGDLGTASIVRNVYEHPDVCSAFKLRAWVKITYPFRSRELYEEYLKDQFEKNSSDKDLILNQPGDDSSHMYLIVLEDVSSMAEWDAFRTFLPNMKGRGRIIVSTQNLEIATLCTGWPYDFFQMRVFSPDHSICVFFKEYNPKESQEVISKGKQIEDKIDPASRTSNDESRWKMIQDISVNLLKSCRLLGWDWNVKTFDTWICSASSSNTHLVLTVRLICESVTNADFWEPLRIIKIIYYHHLAAKTFKRCAWINASHPFDINEFCQKLFLACCSTSSYHQGSHDFAVECQRLLHEHKCLVVIDGSISGEDWKIIDTRLELQTSRSCIIVVTREEESDDADFEFRNLDTRNSPALPCYEQLGLRSRSSPVLYKMAFDWSTNVYVLGGVRLLELSKIRSQIISATSSETHRVIAVWGTASPYDKSVIVREVFYRLILNENEVCPFDMYAWVHTPGPMCILEFCQMLFLDRCSTSSFQGEDLIKECRNLLHENRCLLVIDSLQSHDDWGTITDNLLLNTSKSCIVVITEDETVARQCATNDDDVCIVPAVEYCAASEFFEAEERQHNHKDITGVAFTALKSFYFLGWDRNVSQLKSRIYKASKHNTHRVVVRLIEKTVTNEGVWEPLCIMKGIYYEHVAGERFNRWAWIRVSHPFDIMEFCNKLYSACCSKSSYHQGSYDFVLDCERLLHDHECLVVIEGSISIEDWELIYSCLKLETSKSCIVIATREKGVPADFELTNLDTRNISPALPCHQQLGLQIESSRPLRKMASNWSNHFYYFGTVRHLELHKLQSQIVSATSCSERHRVISVWGSASPFDKSVIVREVFYRIIRKKACTFDMYAWVHAPGPLCILDLCQELLLDRCSTSSFQGEDLVKECRNLLHENRCLLVIDSLQSHDEWGTITDNLLLNTSKSCIVVITEDETVARQCATHDDDVCTIQAAELCAASDLLKGEGFKDEDIIYRKTLVQEMDALNEHIRSEKAPLQKKAAISWLAGFCLRGRVSEVNQLEQKINFASLSNRYHVIAVYGATGVGKSVLVRTVFYRFVDQGTYDLYAWVHAPVDFDVDNFCQSLISNWIPESSRVAKNLEQLKKMCQQCLSQHRCLVVIDRLKENDNWQSIKDQLLLENSRSCFVIVTTYKQVATQYATLGENAVCHIKELEQEAIIGLVENKSNGDQNPEEVKLFLNKCGGLPAAACALSSYLADKANIREAIQKLINEFTSELETDRRLGQLKDSLSQMYSRFHSFPHVLKKCSFYLSVLPQDSQTLRRSRLVRRWIAESYSVGNDSYSMVKNAEKLFHELVDLGILGQLQQTGAGTTSFQVYSLVLQYIISRETEENILIPLEVSVLKKDCNPRTERVGQHLAIASCWERESFVFDRLDFSRLRSLTVSGSWESFFISVRMRVLRVLDLEGTSDLENGHLDEIVKLLRRLKFLSLRRCSKISKLPRSLGKLRQLQTLDIRGTSVGKLPMSIIKLKMLQYIRAGKLQWNNDAAAEPALPAASANVEQQQAPRDDASTSTSSHAEEKPPFEERTPTPPPPPSSSAESEEEMEMPTSGSPSAESEEEMEMPTSRSPSAESEEEMEMPTSRSPSAESEEEMEMPTSRSPSAESTRSRGRKLCSWFSQPRRHQQVGACDSCIEVPAGIAKLKALHTLGVINVNTVAGRAILEELNKQTQLRKLGLFGINTGNSRHLRFRDSNLESLSLHLQRRPSLAADEIDLPRKLQSLKLYGHVEKMPGSIKDLRNLEKLSLEMITLTQEDIQVLGKLKRLHTLRLQVNNDPDAVVRFCSTRFVKLQTLRIASTKNLQVMFEKEVLESLQLLEVHYSGAVLRFSELKNLSSLKQVSLRGVSLSDSCIYTIWKELQNQVDAHENEPSLKLERITNLQ